MLNPDKIIKHCHQKTTEFTLMYSSLQNKVRDELPREVYLRPSMLPTCSLKLLDALIAEELNECSDWGFPGDYFTSVGTTIHELIERWCGHTNFKIWGHWVCPNCGHKHEYTHENDCSKCGTKMGYHEIEVEYMGFKGHIDCIILTKKGIQICDYKTSTKDKVDYRNYKKHNMGYPLQINAYAYILEKLWGQHFQKTYGKSVCGASLLFISRDNPFKFKEFHWTSDVGFKIGRAILLRSLVQFRTALSDYKNKEVRRTICHKSCVNRDDYETREKKFHTYGDCYLMDICFNKKKLETYFNERFKLLKGIPVKHLDK